MFIESRKSLRLKEFDYSSHRAYFITICAYEKKDVFGSVVDFRMKLNDLGQMISDIWQNMFIINVSIKKDQYIVMPNHFHAILLIVEDNVDTLGNYIGRFKSFTTHKYNTQFRSNNAARKILWQRNYYDHIIRNDISLDKIRAYILNNPARWYLDKENPGRKGEDDFEIWLESFSK